MNKAAEKKLITVSKRNVNILLTLTLGPLTLRELKENCFRKDQDIDYKSFRKKEDGLVDQARDADPYVSRQFMERKLKKLEKRELIGSTEYFQITGDGMPIRDKIYYLTEGGCHHVSRSFKVARRNIRYGQPRDVHIDHELNLTRILWKIYVDAKSGQYQISFAHADRALRSIFCSKLKGMKMSLEKEHFLDLNVGIRSKNGNIEIPLELANLKDDPGFWKDKVEHVQYTFYILVRKSDFVGVIVSWIRELKLDYPMFVAPLQSFLRHGLVNTTWEKISAGNVTQVSLNL